MMLKVAASFLALCAVHAFEVHRRGAKVNTSVEGPFDVSPKQSAGTQVFLKSKGTTTEPGTFPGFYDGHKTGRGIWKWQNALVAYQRHFGGFAGYPVSIAEIGVQSGGSLLMWRSVLGDMCRVYGLDINPACRQFADPHTTITIGDQASPDMWNNFFGTTCKSLDILIDDGGHMPKQMLTTLMQVFPRLNPGGFISIEDIHGQHYIESFFTPTAGFLGKAADTGHVASVHVYPFVLIAHKAGTFGALQPQELSFRGSSASYELPNDSVALVSLLKQLSKLPSHSGVSLVFPINKAWGASLLSESNMYIFFSWFGDLHASAWRDDPPGCQHTSAAVCTTLVMNSELQSLVTGIHIYPAQLVVEVPAETPVILAVRRGDKFISYK